jgi:hypothetical protein
LINVSKLTATAFASSTIQRIGSSNVATAATGADATSVTFGSLTGSDFEIAPSTTVYYVVKAVITKDGTHDNDDYIQASLGALNGSSSTANFAWTDATGAGAKYELRLDGVSSISGTKLAE